MANLRGFSDKTGKRKKQRRKQTAAPRLHAMKMSIRSHRLTGGIVSFLFFFFLFGPSQPPTQEQSLQSPGQSGATKKIGVSKKVTSSRGAWLTGKKTVFFFTSICRRQRSSRSFMSGQLHITLILSKRVKGLKPRKEG